MKSTACFPQSLRRTVNSFNLWTQKILLVRLYESCIIRSYCALLWSLMGLYWSTSWRKVCDFFKEWWGKQLPQSDKHARLSGILGQGWPSVELSAATVRLPLVPTTVWSSSRSSCLPSTDASDGDTAKPWHMWTDSAVLLMLFAGHRVGMWYSERLRAPASRRWGWNLRSAQQLQRAEVGWGFTSSEQS